MHIYSITNKLNGKIYIGQTVQNLEKYLSEQNYRAKNYTRQHKPKLYAAIRKYGIENFAIESLMECYSMDAMNIAEMAFIELFNAKIDGYNVTDGGGGRRAYRRGIRGKR